MDIIMLIAFILIPSLFIINKAAKNRAEEENRKHNESEKNDSRFVPATDQDAKKAAGCITIIFGLVLGAIILVLISAEMPH